MTLSAVLRLKVDFPCLNYNFSLFPDGVPDREYTKQSTFVPITEKVPKSLNKTRLLKQKQIVPQGSE